MPLADVSSTYADIVETVFSSTIAAKAWLATAAIRARGSAGAHGDRGCGGKLKRVVRLPFDRTRQIHIWSGRVAVPARCRCSSTA